MKKRFWLLTLILAMVACVAMFFVACDDNPDTDPGGPGVEDPNNDPDDPDETEVTITLNRSTLPLGINESSQLKATVTGTTETVVWASSKESVATVDQTGLVRGVKDGVATITASVAGESASCTVTVREADLVPQLTVSGFTGSKLVLADNETVPLTAAVTFENGSSTSGATVEWTSKDETVAKVTVNEENSYLATVAGQKKGNTEITVKATIGNGKSASKTIAVEVTSEGVKLTVTNYPKGDNGYLVSLKAAEEEENDGTTEATPIVSGVYQDAPIENLSLSWEVTEGVDIVEVNETTGKITALAAGEATVVGTYHSTELNEDFTVTVVVTVTHLDVEIEGTMVYAFNHTDTVPTITLEEDETKATGLWVNGDIGNAPSVEGGQVVLDQEFFEGATRNEEIEIRLTTEKRSYTFTVKILDAVIGGEGYNALEDWKQIWKAGQESFWLDKKIVVLIAESFDASSWNNGDDPQNSTLNFNDSTKGYQSLAFNGILDGQGNTIYGLRAANNGIFYSLGEDGVIQNLALVGIRFTTGGTARIFGNKIGGTIRNCYFEGTGTGTKAEPLASTLEKNARIENVVLNIHDIKGDGSKLGGLFTNYNNGAIEPSFAGVYVVNDDCNGKSYTSNLKSDGTEFFTDEDVQDIHVYATPAALKGALEGSLPTGFSGECWELYDGYPVFKSATTYIDDVIENAESTFEVKEIASVTTGIPVDLSIYVSADLAPYIKWEVRDLGSDDYTLEGHVLTLKDAASSNVTFSVVASYTEKTVGKVISAESNRIKIEEPVGENVTLDNVLFGLNHDAIDIDLTTESKGAPATITSVKVNGQTLTNGATTYYSYEQATGKLTVYKAAFSAKGDSIPMEIIARDTYLLNARVVDVVIGGEGSKNGALEDWKKIWTSGQESFWLEGTPVILLAESFDSSGWDGVPGFTNNSSLLFNGTWDGQGHTIYGLKVSAYGIFWVLGAEGSIKNLALVGMRFAGRASIIGNMLQGVIENCYFEGTGGDRTAIAPLAGTMHGKVARVENVVVNIHDRAATTTNNGGVFDKFNSNTDPTFKNVYVVNDDYNGLIYTTNPGVELTGINLYNSTGALKSALKNSLPTDFSEDYWMLYEGYPVFKSAAQERGEEGSLIEKGIKDVTFTVQSFAEATIGVAIDLSEYVPADLAANVIWEVRGLGNNDYKLEKGILTLHESAAAAQTTFSLVATYTEKTVGKGTPAEINNITVKEVKGETIDLGKILVGLVNRTSVTVELASRPATITSVSVGGETLTNGATTYYGYDPATGKVTIYNEAFTTKDDAIAVQIVSTNTYTLSARVADYAVGTVDEWIATWSNDNIATLFTDKTIVLENDIKLNGAAAGNGTSANHSFDGILDGQGYTVSGMTVGGGYGFLPGLTANGVIRNISFTGMILKTRPVIFHGHNYGVMENCYFEADASGATNDGQFGILGNVTDKVTSKLENVVVYIHGTTEKRATYGVVASLWATDVSGVYVINELAAADNVCNAGGAAALATLNYYTSLAEFKSAFAESGRPGDMSEAVWNLLQAFGS